MIKVINVVGTRPNFIKIAPIMVSMKQHEDEIAPLLVHTGQHCDDTMSNVFFRDLRIPKPHINLSIQSGSHIEQITQVMRGFEQVLLVHKPDWVIVVGDVNSTIGCALAANKLSVKLAHVESGLRGLDRTVPEEVNRVLTDHLSDMLFTSSADAGVNLQREGIDSNSIYHVGNVLIDTLYQNMELSRGSNVLEILGVTCRDFAVLTLHRPENVDNPTILRELLNVIQEIALNINIIFPIHPLAIPAMSPR